MELTVEATPTATVIRVHASRIDAPTALQFKEDMRSLTARQDGRFILDLQSVQFIDSSGLGAVVASMKQLRPGQALELAALQPIVEKVFRLTRMDTIFTIHETAEQGVGTGHG
ncbi:STAS domain-containing protein [Marivita sp.]|uniref:STAS domain-containing protein n=1 Tax=Marivita sp. TaxID=2003365 RepID=UPI003F6EF96D